MRRFAGQTQAPPNASVVAAEQVLNETREQANVRGGPSRICGTRSWGETTTWVLKRWGGTSGQNGAVLCSAVTMNVRVEHLCKSHGTAGMCEIHTGSRSNERFVSGYCNSERFTGEPVVQPLTTRC